MRSMMLLAMCAICGCCAKKQACVPQTIQTLPEGTIFYNPKPGIVTQLPPAGPPIPLQEQGVHTYPPLPPTNTVEPPPAPMFNAPQVKTPKVKVLEVTPVPYTRPAPIDVLPLPDDELIRVAKPRVKKTERNFKILVLENPPYNGPPTLGCEIAWKW